MLLTKITCIIASHHKNVCLTTVVFIFEPCFHRDSRGATAEFRILEHIKNFKI